MAFPERIAELDRQIAAAVERAVAGVRAELQSRLDRLSEELKSSLAQELPAANLPASFLAAADIEPLTSEAASQAARNARDESLADLRDAVAEIDRARQQSDILRALLSGASKHASRVALFLVTPAGARGWSATGFADDRRLADLTVTWDDEEPWLELRQGLGSVELTAADCARLLARVEDSLPQGGALLPLVLRDRVAAAIYADRLDERATWSLPALQTLTWSAALALETLPFRERAATPTLRSLADAAGEGGLSLWDPQAVAEAEPEPMAAVAVEEEPEIESPMVAPAPAAQADFAVLEAGTWEAEPLPEVTAPAGFAFDEPPHVEVEPPPPVMEAPAVEEPAEMAGEWMYEEAPLPEPPPAPAEPAATVAFEAWRPEPVPVPAPPPAPAADLRVPELLPPPPPPALEEPRPPALDVSEDDTHLMAREPRAAAPPPAVAESAPAVASSSTQEVPSVDEDVTHPGIAPSPAVTAAVPQTGKSGWQSGGSTEVAPPPDLQGPGWAFATTRIPTVPAAPEDASHDEARRLARLLVSEIKLYNEEQVEDGRRNRDIYERLKEDIDRSRQMYEERVEERIRNTTDYFYQELVRILAGGDPRAMGI